MSDSGNDADAGEDAKTHHVCMFVYRLYTSCGEKIIDPSQLINGEVYVAVGLERGGQFQHRDYERTKFHFDRRGRKRYPFQWRKLPDRYGCYEFMRGRLLASYR